MVQTEMNELALTPAKSDKRPGALVEVTRLGDYSLWTYGRNGTGWAIFRHNPDGELTCVFNGAIGPVMEKWKELTT